ncbi:MAG: lysoplasmalogenase [Gammaproteobacteria bacterium]|nr:lysoplasmalogenase [Gammaproteobacteria bacterium]
MGASIVVCALAMAGLLFAERRESQAGKWFTKPVASAAFIAVAVFAGALDSDYGRLILLGLGLCLLGDVLLIPEGRLAVFRAGVFAFLAGHVAFAAAFLTQPRSMPWLAVAVVALALALSGVWRWLSPSLPGDMRLPVQAYFVVIGVMTALACAVSGAGGPPVVAAGAIAFTASDISVARDRFVRQEFVNRAWGLPLYYLAQVLLALSPSLIGG